MLLLHRVVIPVNEVHIIGDHGLDPVGDADPLRIIATAAGQAEEHISPHDQLQIVFPGDLGYPVQVLQQNIKLILIAVEGLIFASAQHHGLIHTDIDNTGTQSRCQGSKHPVYQFIYPVISCQQNVICIPHILIFRPMHQGIHMGKGLDAGDQLHPLLGRVVIHTAQLLPGVASAQMPEIGLCLDFIGVLQV